MGQFGIAGDDLDLEAVDKSRLLVGNPMAWSCRSPMTDIVAGPDRGARYQDGRGSPVD